MLTFSEDRWVGNKWASIEIEPVDGVYFLPVLFYLTTTYHFPQPHIIDGIDGYLTSFRLLDCDAILTIDTWTFSIAFERDHIRDTVLEALRALPDDYFKI